MGVISTATKAITQKAGSAVSKSDAKAAAKLIKETYNKTEPEEVIAEKLQELAQKDPEIFQAIKGKTKNPKLQLQELQKIPDFSNRLGKVLAQEPRSVREAIRFKKENEPAPFEPPTIVSRAADKYPAESQGLSGLAATPDITPSGAGGFNPPVKTQAPIPTLDLGPAPKTIPTLDIAEDVSLPSSKGNNRAAALGVGTAAVGGTAAVAGLMGGEQTPSGEYAPVARPDGTIGMSDAEFKAIEKEKGTVVALREQEKKYKDINDKFQAQQRDVSRLTRTTLPDLSTPSGQKQSQTAAQRYLAELSAPEPTPPEAPVREEIKPLKEKEEPTEKPVPPGGEVLGEATQPAVVPDKNPTPEAKGSQESLPAALQGLLQDRKLIDSITGAGRVVSRKRIIDAIKNLENVESDIQNLYDKNPPPEVKDISDARRAAYEAYKTKADRAEWLGIIDRAIGAIGQFAAAQAALGKPYVGNYRPSYGDYDAKVQRALQEYQMETGLLKEEQAESKQARSEAEAKIEKGADALRRSRQLQLEVAKEETRAEQDVIDSANDMSRMLFQANTSLKEKMIRAEELRQEAAKKQGKEQIEAQKDITELDIRATKEAIDEATRLNQVAAVVAANPSEENVAKLTALYPRNLQDEIKQREEFFDRDKTKALATQIVNSNTDRLNTLRNELLNAQQRQKALIGGTVPATGQQPQQRATVTKAQVLEAVKSQPGYTYEKAKQYYESQGYQIIE